MTAPSSPHRWVYWLEAGGGVRWVRRLAAVLGLLLLSVVVAHTQFRGPRTEETLRQAAAARQWAEGRGFVSPAIDPQAVAWHEARGGHFAPDAWYPELRYPPLYPAALAGVLAALPAGWREAAFARAPEAPDGFRADYLLLAVNVVLLWLAAVLTWRLGCRLFGGAAGAAAAVALLLSAAVWEQTVAVNGTPLAMVLWLALAWAMVRAWAAGAGGRAAAWWAVAGAAAGGMFLCDYPLGVVAPSVAAAAAWRLPAGRRAGRVALVLGAALLVAAPWLVRNTMLSGHPLGLAWHDVALRAGDPTAEPEAARRSFDAAAPAFELRKVANKGLTALQEDVGARIWSGGLFLNGLFFAGWLYRFRHDEARALRAWFTAAWLLAMGAQGFLNSGEGERLASLAATPLVLVFGAGFFRVLLASREEGGLRPAVAWGILLLAQAVPLVQDVAEPRRVHFAYPPYHPFVYLELGRALRMEHGPAPGWMADLPAGAAWYSGRRVWAQPATLREFHVASTHQPIVALVLSPHTLDRPFFSELLRAPAEPSRFGDWGRLYSALAQDRVPADFPLSQQERLADNFRVLAAPGALRPSVK
jgi:hypothetical protein